MLKVISTEKEAVLQEGAKVGRLMQFTLFERCENINKVVFFFFKVQPVNISSFGFIGPDLREGREQTAKGSPRRWNRPQVANSVRARAVPEAGDE